MWGWFKPKCSIDVREKLWLEINLAMLYRWFGVEKLHEIAPRVYQQSALDFALNEEEAALLYHAINQQYGVEVPPDLRFFDQQDRPDASGLYVAEPRPEVWISRDNLDHQGMALCTIAHELAHHLLIGANRLTGREEYHEYLTDMTTIVFGYGVIRANHSFAFRQWRDPSYSYWQTFRNGYMPSHLYGYLLALIAWERNEQNADWSKGLNVNSHESFQINTKYLFKTEDSFFKKLLVQTDDRLIVTNPQAVAKWTDTEKLATVWDMHQLPADLTDDQVKFLSLMLKDRCRGVRAETARLIAARQLQNPAWIPLLEDLLCDHNDEVCAYGLAAMLIQSHTAIHRTSIVQNYFNSEKSTATLISFARTIYQQAEEWLEFLPLISNTLRQCYVKGNLHAIYDYQLLLVAMTEKPVDYLLRHWPKDEFRLLAVDDIKRLAKADDTSDFIESTGDVVSQGEYGLLPIFYPSSVNREHMQIKKYGQK
jgi:hypothetical protein